jgi:spore maturation protein CgeB
VEGFWKIKMPAPKRIFIIADFKDEKPQSIRIERRHWTKGFVRLGHDVQRFSYRNILLQFSPLKSKGIAHLLAKKQADLALAEQVKHYHPDIVIILGMKHLDWRTVDTLRTVAPKAIFIGRDTAAWPENDPDRIAIARKMDIVIATNAGKWLQFYKDAGVPCCAFIPCPCDPDIQRPYEVVEQFRTDIIFAGKAQEPEGENDPDRYSILHKLSTMPNARLYACFGNPPLEGIDYFQAISNAKIALSINAVNSVRLYHSDRLVECLACGAFVLAKRVPDSDLLFKDRTHLRYFDNPEDFFSLVDWYLRNEDERKRIARAGMERAHSEFNCEKMAKHVLDLVEKGSYMASWVEIL